MAKTRERRPLYFLSLLLASLLLALAGVGAAPLAAASPAIPVAGLVVGGAGKVAVAGARVEVRPLLGEFETGRLRLAGTGEAPAPVASATSDASGRFMVTVPEAGMWALRIVAPGFVPVESELTPVLEAVDLPTAELAVDAGLTVRVRDAAGRPVTGITAQILARPRTTGRFGPGGWSPAERLGSAGPDGSVRIPRARSEALDLLVVAPGLPPVEVRAEGSASPEVVLSAGVPRTLRAVDEQGKPLAGALVFDSEVRLALGTTDAQGLWTAAVGRKEGLGLSLRTAGGLRGTVRLEAGPAASPAPGAEPVAVRLRASAALAGRVVDLASRQPVAGALVWLSGSPEGFVRSDARGGYTLRIRESSRAAIEGAAPGYLRASTPLKSGLGGAGRGPTLALEPAARVEGRVVDAARRPIAGAEVTAVEQSANGMPRGFGRPPLLARSASDGRFRLSSLAGGRSYDLTCTRSGFAAAKKTLESLRPFETRTVELILGAGRRGVGRVTDAAKRPVAGARVRLAEVQESDIPVPIRRLMNAETKPAEATSDAAGRFELPGLNPGRYDLSAEAAGFAPVSVPGIEVAAGEGEAALGTLVLSSGVAVEGVVVDAAGAPVAEAEVFAQAQGEEALWLAVMVRGGGPEPGATTAADGRFTLADRSPGERLTVTIHHAGYSDQSVAGVKAPTAEPIRVVLVQASRVSGRVLDADRRPVEGAAVQASSETERFSRNRAVSDADGRFEIADVTPGVVTVSAQASGLLDQRLSGLKVPPGGELSGVELVLQRAAVVEGSVTGPDGRPVAGAFVRAFDPSAGQMQGRMDMRSMATSDGDGFYRLDTVAVGPRSVSADHEGFSSATRDVDVRPGVNTVDLSFAGGYEVSGRVVDSGGEPVAGANLSLSDGSFGLGRLPPAKSAADGSFTFTSVPPGRYTVGASLGAYRQFDAGEPFEVANAPVSGLTVRLGLGKTTLTGRLLGLAPADRGRVEIQAYGKSGWRSGQAAYDGTYRIEGLEAGEWSVSARIGDSGRHARGKIVLPEGAGEESLDLDFAGGFTLSGTAFGGGTPLRGARVSASGVGVEGGASAVTDQDGAFRLENLPAGHYRLELSAPSGARRQQELDLTADRSVRIDLATARLTGHLRDAGDGSPIEGARVVAAPAGPAAEPSPADFFFGSGIVSDSRGLFSLGEVAEGSWRVTATKAGYSPAELAVEVREGENRDDVDLALTATQGITFEPVLASGLPAGRVDLAVLDAAGRTVAAGTFEPTEGGRIRASTVPAGSWELLLTTDDSATAHLPITSPGALGRLVLPAGGRVDVTVPDLAANPIPARLSVIGPDGRPYRGLSWGGVVGDSWPVTAGRADYSGLPVGRCTLKVTATDGRSWTGTADVTPGGTAEVTLR